MPDLTYPVAVSPRDKPVVWLKGEVKTPPFIANARMDAGFLLRQLQRGESLSLPQSRPMPDIGAGSHELRIADGQTTWRIVYCAAPEAVVILEVFAKKTTTTPNRVITDCKTRLAAFRKVLASKKGINDAR